MFDELIVVNIFDEIFDELNQRPKANLKTDQGVWRSNDRFMDSKEKQESQLSDYVSKYSNDWSGYSRNEGVKGRQNRGHVLDSFLLRNIVVCSADSLLTFRSVV